jgi:hypothetical protein
MDASDLSLKDFLIQELECEPVEEKVVSLEDMRAFQRNIPPDVSKEDHGDILDVKFTAENYCHIRLRLKNTVSFEIAKETVKRYYLEAGYEITDHFDPDTEKSLFTVTFGADTVSISCRITDGNF